MIKRRKTRQLKIGNVKIGGGAPVSIQSMTKTDTKDVRSTLTEIAALEDAGCEIVRIAIKDHASIPPLGKIIQKSNLPVEADVHFIPQLALDAISAGSSAIRINPGNINKEEDIKKIAMAAKRAGIPARIGVNSGSLALKGGGIADNMVKSAITCAKIFEKSGFHDVMISLKSSSVTETIEAYRKMAGLCDYPFHLGITAAGPFISAAVKSAIGIGALLLDGIGDTIRVSLTDDAVREIESAKEILSALGLRHFGPEIISCPTCGRCQVDLFNIVKGLQGRLWTMPARGWSASGGDHASQRLVRLRRRPWTKRPFTIAVMGCEVNGPGEAAHADIGIAAGKGSGVLFKKGKVVKRIKESEFVKVLVSEIGSC